MEENQLRADYNPANYYLFSRDISGEDAQWATKNSIMTVAAVNSFAFPKDNKMEAVRRKTEQLKENGVLIFQIDSEFEEFFK